MDSAPSQMSAAQCRILAAVTSAAPVAANPVTVEITDTQIKNQYIAGTAITNFILPQQSSPSPTPSFETRKQKDLATKFENVMKHYTNQKLSSFPVSGYTKRLELKKISVELLMKKIKFSNILFMDDGKNKKEQDDGEVPGDGADSQHLHAADMESETGTKSTLESNEQGVESLTTFDLEDDSDQDTISISSSESNRSDEGKYEPKTCKGMLGVFQYLIANNIRCALISAGGGRGKTISAMQLMALWAANECLPDFIGVILMDMKLIDFNKDLYQNMLMQYQCIERNFSPEEVKEVPGMMQNYQDKCLFLLDGLDESKSKQGAQKFLKKCLDFYNRSSFIMTTRLDGKDTLKDVHEEWPEFKIVDLSQKQYEELIRVFPFSGDGTEKRKLLSEACETNDAIRASMSIPFSAITTCLIFEHGGIKSVEDLKLGIFDAIVALAVKSTRVKEIERKLEQDENLNQKEKDSLTEEQTNYLNMDLSLVFNEIQHMIYALGRGIFKSNGNLGAGMEDLKDVVLRQEMKHENMTKEDIEFVLKWNIYERVQVESFGGKVETFFRFYHRNVREYVSCYYMSKQPGHLDLPLKKDKLKGTNISLFKCAIFQILCEANGKILQERIMNVIGNVIQSCSRADKWKIVQMLAEVVEMVVHIPDQAKVVGTVLEKTVKMIWVSNLPLDDRLKEGLTSKYVQVVASHAVEQSCGACKLPVIPKKKVNQHLELKTLVPDEGGNWPDEKNCIVSPVFVKTEEMIIFAFPGKRWKFFWKDHVDEMSHVLPYKKPQLMEPLSLPFPTSTIPCPEDMSGDKQFIATIDDKIHVGIGKRDLWTFELKTRSFKKENPRGEVDYDKLQPSFSFPIVIGNSIWMLHATMDRFSVYDGRAKTWTLVRAEGASPPKITNSCIWTLEGDIFIFGGDIRETPSSTHVRGAKKEIRRSNDIFRFTVVTRKWSHVPTSSPRPEERVFAASVVVSDGRVYVFGGINSTGSDLNDLWVFYPKTSKWEEIPFTGGPSPRWGSSLTTINGRFLLLVGGYAASESSSETFIFDTKEKTFSPGIFFDFDLKEAYEEFELHYPLTTRLGKDVFIMSCYERRLVFQMRVLN